jgi:type I restriction enzyme S subunit
VAKVEQLMALVDRLEAQLAASRKNAGKLLEAVVAELTAAGSLDIAGRISDAEPTTWTR